MKEEILNLKIEYWFRKYFFETDFNKQKILIIYSLFFLLIFAIGAVFGFIFDKEFNETISKFYIFK